MMTWVHSSKMGPSSPRRPLRRRCRRWAASLMGVRGFFTSWAIRRATSLQAASRWALSNSVKSSNTSTNPRSRPASSLSAVAVSYTHLRAHETRHDLVCRPLLEKKNTRFRHLGKKEAEVEAVELTVFDEITE